MANSPNGTILATSDSHNIHLWEPNTGDYIQMIYHRGWLSHPKDLVFSPDGNTLASTEYGAIHLWDINSKAHINTIL